MFYLNVPIYSKILIYVVAQFFILFIGFTGTYSLVKYFDIFFL